MSAPVAAKTFDREYFETWYRGTLGDGPVVTARAQAYVDAAELNLKRPIRTVLDVGCGEGRWRAPLLEYRPELRYQGVDPSPYCAETFGDDRNICLGSVTELGDLPGRYDLVICSDVLHYLDWQTVQRGVGAMITKTGGVLHIWAVVSEERRPRLGDTEGLIVRPRSVYESLYARLGLKRWSRARYVYRLRHKVPGYL